MATTGLGSRRIWTCRSVTWKRPTSAPPATYPVSPRTRWSPPEQNASGPSPVSTITPTDVSSRERASASEISTIVCGRNALRTSGRAIVIFAMPSPDSSSLMSSYSPADVQVTGTAPETSLLRHGLRTLAVGRRRAPSRPHRGRGPRRAGPLPRAVAARGARGRGAARLPAAGRGRRADRPAPRRARAPGGAARDRGPGRAAAARRDRRLRAARPARPRRRRARDAHVRDYRHAEAGRADVRQHPRERARARAGDAARRRRALALPAAARARRRPDGRAALGDHGDHGRAR